MTDIKESFRPVPLLGAKDIDVHINELNELIKERDATEHYLRERLRTLQLENADLRVKLTAKAKESA